MKQSQGCGITSGLVCFTTFATPSDCNVRLATAIELDARSTANNDIIYFCPTIYQFLLCQLEHTSLIPIPWTVFRETAETIILPLAMPSARLAYATILESKTRILPLQIKKCPKYCYTNSEKYCFLMLGYASLAPQPTAITVAKFLRIGISSLNVEQLTTPKH